MSNRTNTLERLTAHPQADKLAAHRARIDAMLAEEAAAPWTNPGNTPQERAFFARKRAEYEAKQGIAPSEPAAPVQWFKQAGSTIKPPAPTRERKARVKRGYRHHRRNEWFIPGQHQTKLDRNQVAKILFLAESLERKTKDKGRFNGLVGKAGLEILRALLKQFYNYRNGGQCDPSYDAIQRATGFCRQTIADAIQRLEACRIITVVRRLVRVMTKTRCPVTGQVIECPATQQTSNAYMFNVAAEPKPTQPPGWSWPDDCRNPTDSLSVGAESTRQRESNPIYNQKRINGMSTDRCRIRDGGMPPKKAA